MSRLARPARPLCAHCGRPIARCENAASWCLFKGWHHLVTLRHECEDGTGEVAEPSGGEPGGGR